MKKMIIIFIFILTLTAINTKAYKAEKIDLKIKDKEITIVFLRLDTSNSILINDEDSSNLFVLKEGNDKKLNEVLKIFDSNPQTVYLDKQKVKTNKIEVIYKDNIYQFKIDDYTLCITENSEIKACDFVYLTNLDQEFIVDDKIEAIFYDDKIPMKYLKEVQESWIDNHIVSTDSFTILKLNEESYNIVIVPSTNY